MFHKEANLHRLLLIGYTVRDCRLGLSGGLRLIHFNADGARAAASLPYVFLI